MNKVSRLNCAEVNMLKKDDSERKDILTTAESLLSWVSWLLAYVEDGPRLHTYNWVKASQREQTKDTFSGLIFKIDWSLEQTIGKGNCCEISFSMDESKNQSNHKRGWKGLHLNKGTSVYLPNPKAVNLTRQMHHTRTNAAMAYRGASESWIRNERQRRIKLVFIQFSFQDWCLAFSSESEVLDLIWYIGDSRLN